MTEDQRTFCWGGNVAGQLGMEPSPIGEIEPPVELSGGYEFAVVAAGNQFTCGVTSASIGMCWGGNLFGNLGDLTRTDRPLPDSLAGGGRYVEIAAGVHHACALYLDGRASCWGNNSDRRLRVGESPNVVTTPRYVVDSLRVERLSVGASHACALLQGSSSAHCWGRNDHGQLGNGSIIPGSAGPVVVAGGHTFVEVHAAEGHTCGLTGAGGVMCWGLNQLGQLGDGSGGGSDTPVSIASAETFETMTAGGNHSCAVTTSGNAVCWGHNQLGALGTGDRDGRPVPAAVTGGHVFRQLSAGGFRTCGVTDEGSMLCWGGSTGLAATSAVSVPTRLSFR